MFKLVVSCGYKANKLQRLRYDLEQLRKSMTISNDTKMLILFCSQTVFIMICALERVALLSLAYVGSVTNKLKLIVIYSQQRKDI
ncbi:hypothetical protein T07_4489 [Trichinella nelsoni]|uniref:Uncharacterized protein n=1 Tax=Trichinella nelsoni TaxID=6336 RepID=A0A0V0SAB4_9BILA|nr:hypothetical protein T07_4489 [Trichinella nelsoni]